MTVKIVLNTGQVAFVDDADAYLANFHWTAHNQSHGISYATRSERVSRGVRRTVLLHRQVMGFGPNDPLLDHIDGDGLNCRRANLRENTTKGNACNRSGPNRTNLSCGVLGVSYRKDRKKYRSAIKVDGVTVHLGLFETLKEASDARLKAEAHYWGIQPRRADAHGGL